MPHDVEADDKGELQPREEDRIEVHGQAPTPMTCSNGNGLSSVRTPCGASARRVRPYHVCRLLRDRDGWRVGVAAIFFPRSSRLRLAPPDGLDLHCLDHLKGLLGAVHPTEPAVPSQSWPLLLEIRPSLSLWRSPLASYVLPPGSTALARDQRSACRSCR
jgi:hypothetical protein